MTVRIPAIFTMALLIVSLTYGSLYGSSLELLSRSLMQGPGNTVTFHHDLLILGTGGGIALAPVRGKGENIKYLAVDGEPLDIAVHGSVAYMAAKRGGLIVVRLGDGSNPAVEYQHKTRQATGCAICNRFLYLADNNRDIYTFDLNNPVNPRLSGTTAFSGQINALLAEYDLVVVISNRKFVIYHSGPTGKLKTLNTTRTDRIIKKGILKNGIIYLVYRDGDMEGWGISDPSQPRKIWNYTGGDATDLCVGESRGYFLTGSNHIKRVDIPPVGTKQEMAEGNNSGNRYFKIEETLEIEYAGDRKEEGWNMGRLLDLFRSGKAAGSGIFCHTGWLATIDPKQGLYLYRLDDHRAELEYSISTSGFAVDLVAVDNLLYLANGGDGVRIGRVNRNGSINWIGHIQTKVARDIAVQGNIAYLADGEAGLKVIDVSDPARPVQLGQHDSPFFHSAIVAQDNRVYVAGGLGGLEIYRVSDPRRPKLIWRHEFSEVRGLEVDRDYLYFADGDEGFRIYSIREMPPSPVSRINTNGWNCDCFILGDVACLADGGRGIKTVDISDRTNPKLLGELYLKTLTRELHAIDGTLFAAGHSAGIFAIDVSAPGSPRITARSPVVDDARGVFADGKFVYLASASGGVYVFRYHQ